MRTQNNTFLRWITVLLICALCFGTACSWGGSEEPTPTATLVAEATTTPTTEPTEAPLVTNQPTAQTTEIATEAPTPENTATPEAGETAAPRPTATPTPRPTATPKPTATPMPRPTATPKPTATPTPKPTATPVPKVKVGDSIYFGSYEQDNDTSNGKETIQWRVLDVQDGKALLISEKALDSQKYNTSNTYVTWETCTLRQWLNGTFLNNAFSADEQAKIATTTVSADKNPNFSTNPGNATNDKVFLLSIAEAQKYFTTDESRMCAPTVYAKAQGALTSSSYQTASGEAACFWWLRSPGPFQSFAAIVYYDGSVDYVGDDVDYDFDCVRPAMWITLD